MITVQVPLGARSYPIIVGDGLLKTAGEIIARIVPASSSVILSHPHLARLYAAPVIAGLKHAGIPSKLITVAPGERTKNLATSARLYGRLLESGIDRRSVLITLGGGVLGDLGGFVAATYLRGIDFVQMPTTLLAQVDASIGGKTGVDLPQGKNLVGAFHQPRAVLIDVDSLDSLASRELRSGLAEVIKYGIIRDKGLFDRLQNSVSGILRRNRAALTDAIVRSCEIKAQVVAEDETERGVRAILNFGHTVAHAIESATGYRRYKHGEAVAIGMVSAALIGEEIGFTPPDVTEQIQSLLLRSGLPVELTADISIDQLLAAMELDKKTVAGKLNFVLASAIGEVRLMNDVAPRVVSAALKRQRRLA